MILGPVVIFAIGLQFGWELRHSSTKDMNARLEAGRRSIAVKTYSPKELAALPAPVQSYLRTILKEGQPMVSAVSLQHAGTFIMSEARVQRRPFIAAQRVITQRPAFDWEARISIMYGLSVRMPDAYVAGEGILHASLLGLVSPVNLRGTPEVEHGELMRFLAEAAWYQTALLPSQGILWERIDESSAKATLKDGQAQVTMLFRFDKKGLIISVSAEGRWLTVAGELVPRPWEGRWSN